MTTGANLLTECLIAEGVQDVFGLPGLQLDPAMSALHDASDRITLHPVVHEQSATYMADGYARTRGTPGVAMVVPGPGMLNATAGLSTAYACSSPVLAVVGQIRSDLIGRGFGALHEIPDQSGVLRGLTKWHHLVRHPDEIPAAVHEAFRQLRSGVTGPVALEVPPDVLRMTARATPLAAATPEHPRPDARVLATVRDLVGRAERPAIIAGGGVRAARAGDDVLALAEATGAPIVTTRNGRGAFDSRHPLVLDPLAMRRVRDDADLILALGTRLGSTDGEQADVGEGTLVIVDLDSRMFVPPRRPDVAVLADAGAFARELTDALRSSGHRPTDRRAECDELRDWIGRETARLEPQHAYLRAIREALPSDGVFVSEYTQVGYVASVSFPVHAGGDFISPGYQGTLGYGFATALGAQVGAGDRAVVSVTGDGGFAWTLPELATAKRERIPLVTVVFNDGHYGNVRRMQRDDWDGRYIASTLTNPDFATLADAYGIASVRVHDAPQLQDAVATGLSARAPLLVEAVVGEFPSPWELIDAL
ncbi:thiamine pyrophosphate-binding protein [Microbacterium sp. ET2]|uniref:thiamine pyrophosphate-binding protein n=1 Tax=Microbacterium albipurpureum TaxID=3050384 RepID=UPI00259C6DA1|nr:thiamine pyrophosphate-binding protein [Microbacterium sp. ET2 (Ac-2212)]WJL96744.1 thiamine pyrophosphate-binding protein [Microbacterium sp. ET2 (Ac-2212)]